MQTQDRLSAVDLRGLSDEQMSALREEAIRRGVAFSELLGQLVNEVSDRLLSPRSTPAAAH